MKQNKETHLIDLGINAYKETWDFQEKLFNEIIEKKNNNQDTTNYLIFVEHPHVYTLGKSGVANNLLINEDFLQKISASFIKTNRGGDITYHGFGQIVAYPIIDLENFGLQAKSYIFNLEEVIIQTLKEYQIQASRLNGATGVWLDADLPGKARKICAIGVKLSRFVSMHGFAFNVNTDLNYFNYINPCGFTDKGVTSLEKELGKKVELEKVKTILENNFQNIYGMNIIRQK